MLAQTSALDVAGPAGSTLWIQVLGPVRIWRQGDEVELGPRQQRCIFALIMARAGQPIRMREIVDLVWAGNAPASAVNIVQKYVGGLRRLLEPCTVPGGGQRWLIRQGGGYQFPDDPRISDLALFRSLLAEARAASSDGEGSLSLDLYEQALGLWKGRFAEDVAEYVFPATEFDIVNRQLFDAATEAAALSVRERDPVRLLAPLRHIASWDPLNEPLQARLVEALDAAGYKVEALAVYDSVRERLDQEFGLEPGEDLRAARRLVLSRSFTDLPHAGAADVGGSGGLRPAQLPPDLPVFVGRESESAFVRAILGKRSAGTCPGPVIIGLSGMGGVGKSTFAVHQAHALSGEYTDGQIYLDLRGTEGTGEGVSTREALETMLLSLGIPASDLPNQVDARVALYRSLTAGKKIIVLLDNARNAQQVRSLIPNSAESLVLVTSRTPLASLAVVQGASLLPIGLPSVPTAREILTARLGTVQAAPPLEAVDEIIELCGRLPLALALVAARAAARPDLPLEKLITELRRAPSTLQTLVPDNDRSDPQSIFAWSYHQLSEPAARLFRLLGGSDVPTVSAAACASLLGEEPAAIGGLLSELTESALISEVAPGRFSSHVLVRAYSEHLVEVADGAGARDRVAARLLQHHLHSSYAGQVAVRPHHPPISPPAALPGIFPEAFSGFDEAMAWFTAERPTLVAAVHRAAAEPLGTEAWRLALTLQQYFQWAGFFHDWLEVMLSALGAAERDGDQYGQAHALRSLAGAHYFFGDFTESLDCLNRAHELFVGLGCCDALGYVHLNRGDVLAQLGRYDEALAENEKALRHYQRAGDLQREVRALSEMGHVLSLRGQFEAAAVTLHDALALNGRVGNPELDGHIRIYLAQMHRDRADLEEAVDQAETALDSARRVRHRTLELDALLVLAECRLDLDQTCLARSAWEQATHIGQSFQNGGTRGISTRLRRLSRRLQPG